ncbi:RNA polymerase sigma factor SigJ [Actinacidiphila alni]|uniref:RNA polymerase sigma factor SigJ n=1 Tax=Actinacidiphila alni TaxID=380248 RepID=UPI0034528148
MTDRSTPTSSQESAESPREEDSVVSRQDRIAGERGQLINIAYRLLGSRSEAEDAVQEAYARWYAMSQEKQDAIESPGAWLTTATSRVCLSQLKSARARRESYVGPWVPEPLPDNSAWLTGCANGIAVDPADRITLDESVAMAFLVLLDSMTPAERVAFILHDIFCLTFAEVSEIIGRTPAACRQLASSARRRVRTARAPSATPARHAQVVREFKRAWEAKDIATLVDLLDPEATACADSGGLAETFPEPIQGAESIARAWADLAGRVSEDISLLERLINGQLAVVAERKGQPVSVFTFDVADDRVRHIWVTANPRKIQFFYSPN